MRYIVEYVHIRWMWKQSSKMTIETMINTIDTTDTIDIDKLNQCNFKALFDRVIT